MKTFSSYRRANRFTAVLVRTCLVAAGTFVACGCNSEGPPRAPVDGTVFADGKLLESGMVRFVPIGGTKGPMAVANVVDGFYALPAEAGPVVGTHRVEIVATNYLGFALDDEAAAERARRANRGRLPSSPVPAKFSERSPLTADIPPEGRQGLDFLLSAKGPDVANR